MGGSGNVPSKDRWGTRLHRGARWLAWTLIAFAALLFGGSRLAAEYLNDLIRREVRQLLAEHYPTLQVRIGTARRVPGAGIELRAISLLDPRADPDVGQLLFIDEIMVHCDTRLEALAERRLNIRQVIVRRPTLRAERTGDRSWNVSPLWQPTLRARSGHECIPVVAIEDGTVAITDRRRADARTVSFNDIKLALRAAAPRERGAGNRWELDWEGSFAGELFHRATIRGRCSWPGPWSLRGDFQDLKIVPELPACLPAELASQLQPFAALRGRVDLQYQLRGHEAGVDYDVAGKLSDGWINDATLPYALTHIGATFRCTPAGLRIENASARTDVAQLQLELERAGFAGNSPLTLRAQAKQFPLDRRLPLVLPPNLRSLWERLQPEGSADVELALVFDGRQFQPEARISCRDLAFTYHKFPYRVRAATGSLLFRNGRLTLDLKFPLSGETTTIKGELQLGAAVPVGWVEVATAGAIPLNDELLAAVPAKPQQTLRSLHPSGLVEFWGRFERTSPESPPQKHLEIQLRNCSICYDRFPYPIDRIQGSLTVRNERWYFDRLTGHNDSGFFVAKGSYDAAATDDQHLKLDFECTDVPLHDALRMALKEESRQLWAKLQPRGTIDRLVVGVRYDQKRRQTDVQVLGEKWAPDQNVEGRTISLTPVWFPYRWDNVTGAFHYRNGVVTLRDLRAEHGPVRLKQLRGTCRHQPDGAWQLTLEDVDVEDLAVDADLLEALPAHVARNLAALRWRGPLALFGQLAFSGQREQGLTQATWQLGLDTEDAAVAGSTPLEHIRGGAELVGSYHEGQFDCRGELRFDSLVVRGLHLTHIRGPIRIGAQEIALGAATVPASSPDQPRRSVTARLLGGELALDGSLSLAGDSRFATHLRLADADLERIAGETGRVQGRISGRTHAELRLAGRSGIRESWRGKGQVYLSDADIYELPLMVAMLKLLNVRPPDATAFTKGDMQFAVEGDRLFFQRIALQGDAISLVGSGSVDLQRQVDLDFYALVGREEAQWPIFRPLFSEAARNVLSIKVTGLLQQPTVTPQALPHLNETLQQLFPETSRDGSWPRPQSLMPPAMPDARRTTQALRE